MFEECIVEVKLKENGMGSKGLIGSKDDEDSNIFKIIKMIVERAFDPGICVSFCKRKREFLAMPMEKWIYVLARNCPMKGLSSACLPQRPFA